MPILSILLPTYNGAAFLDLQLRSIMEQSVEEFRLLIVDDGSDDATPRIIADAARHDSRIEVLPGSENQGQRHRLSQLVAACDTDLIAIADQDDLWDREKLAWLLASMGKAAMCFGSSELIDAEGNSLGRDLLASFPPPYQPGDRLSYLFRPLVSAHALIARRELINAKALGRALPFDLLMTLEAAFGAGLVYQPEARTLHRLHACNQNNGVFARAPERERLISRYALRHAVRDWGARRVRLLGMFEHLSYADTVSTGLRRDMASLRATCAAGWLDGTVNSNVLKKTVLTKLRPLAGSDPDWAFAEVNLQSLFSRPLSPARFITRARRLSLLARGQLANAAGSSAFVAATAGSASPGGAHGFPENS